MLRRDTAHTFDPGHRPRLRGLTLYVGPPRLSSGSVNAQSPVFAADVAVEQHDAERETDCEPEQRAHARTGCSAALPPNNIPEEFPGSSAAAAGGAAGESAAGEAAVVAAAAVAAAAVGAAA